MTVAALVPAAAGPVDDAIVAVRVQINEVEEAIVGVASTIVDIREAIVGVEEAIVGAESAISGLDFDAFSFCFASNGTVSSDSLLPSTAGSLISLISGHF